MQSQEQDPKKVIWKQKALHLTKSAGKKKLKSGGKKKLESGGKTKLKSGGKKKKGHPRLNARRAENVDALLTGPSLFFEPEDQETDLRPRKEEKKDWEKTAASSKKPQVHAPPMNEEMKKKIEAQFKKSRIHLDPGGEEYDKEWFLRWRKALVAFRPYKALADRATSGVLAAAREKYEQAERLADHYLYREGVVLLGETAAQVRKARAGLRDLCDEVAKETKQEEKKQKEAFAFTTEVKDKDWGFDSDSDAPNFYLANSRDEFGGMKPSQKLLDMAEVYEKCRERAERLRKTGATIDDIVEAVYKNIPKNFWPDEVVKEVVLFKAVKAELEMEQGLAKFNMGESFEKVVEGAGLVSEKSSESSEYSQMADTIRQNFPNIKNLNPSDLTNALSHLGNITSTLTDGTMGLVKGGKALDAHQELKKTEDNPVKEKILEFQRNKAIIDCLNSFSNAGLDLASEKVASEVVPIIGIVTKSKNALQDVAAAVTYFKNLRQVAQLKKGAALDPRTAALLPLARQAREQKIAAADKVVSAASNLLMAVGKAGQTGGISAPAGVAVDIAGKAIRYGGKIVIAGIKWGDAAAAVKAIKLAVGPPPNRKAQFDVLKNSAKYARAALAHLARHGDPWAIGHLERMGLDRENIDHPATTTNLLREYMALKSGGMFADGVSEDQETFGETKTARAVKLLGRGLAKAGAKVRDLIVDRDTDILYDIDKWNLKAVPDLTVEGWEAARRAAIRSGWYDSRPKIARDLARLEGARADYKFVSKLDTDIGYVLESAVASTATLLTALDAVVKHTRKIKAVANDRVTVHQPMRDFLQQWFNKAQKEAAEVSKQRSKWIDQMKFPEEGDKERFLNAAIKKAQQNQKQRVQTIKARVGELWAAHKFPTPYGAKTFDDFVTTAREKLQLSETATDALRKELRPLELLFLQRVREEMMSTPDKQRMAGADPEAPPEPDEKELKSRFKQSVETIGPMVTEALRGACDRCYKESMNVPERGAGWTPQEADVELTKRAWDGVKQAAAEDGWNKGGATGLTGALANYEKAEKEFNGVPKSPDNRTRLEQLQGVVLGRLDELAKALANFQPLTDNQFIHEGLAQWRDRMIRLCAVERDIYNATLDDL